MTKPLFTTKHYKAIAKIINENYPTDTEEEIDTCLGGYVKLRNAIAYLFKKDNPKFDFDKWHRDVTK